MKYYSYSLLIAFTLCFSNRILNAQTVDCSPLLKWLPTSVYHAGDAVVYQNTKYTANYWTQNNDPSVAGNSGSTTATYWLTGSTCTAGTDLAENPTTPTTIDCSGFSGWSDAAVYPGGVEVVYQNVVYKSLWYTQNEIPANNINTSSNGKPWSIVNTCTAGTFVTPSTTESCIGIPQWSATETYSKDSRVVYQSVVYKALWVTANNIPFANINNGTNGKPWIIEAGCTVGSDIPVSGAIDWVTSGNAITDGQFLGTTISKPLELKANNITGLYVNPEAGSVSVGGRPIYPFYNKFEVVNGLTAFTGPLGANQNNLLTLYSGNTTTAKYSQGFRHYLGFSHALNSVGEEFSIINAFEYNSSTSLGAGKHLLIQNTPEGNLGVGVMTAMPPEKLTVNGNAQIGLGAQAYGVEGTRLYLGPQFENTDPLYLARVNTASDKTTLRLAIGDNGDNNDIMEFGWMATGSNVWTPSVRIGANGTLVAKEVCVNLTLAWCDYVFEEDYKLTPLKDLKTFINKYKHLPEIPSAKEMEKGGLNLNQMVTLQMKKIEELTLYTISQEEKIEQLEERLSKLEELYTKLK